MSDNKPKTIIAYLDKVVINTLSGEQYPTNFFDMRVNFAFLKSLGDYSPDRLVLFANRTIIHKGTKISNPEFWSKINFIRAGISNFMRLKHKPIPIHILYSIAQEWKLGLDKNSDDFIKAIPNFDPSDTLFIGTEDKTGEEFCKEFNLKFITINQFYGRD